MSNRINGDFDPDSIEAFRAAYAAQILEPEDQEVDPYTGLPTDLVLNTSPWIQHTGLWKANDGTNKDFVPNQVLVAGEAEEDDDDLELTPEEIDALLAELEDEDEGEAIFEEDEEIESLIERLLSEDEGYYDNSNDDGDETLTDEEIENLLEELRLESESDDYEPEADESEDEEITEDEIDAIIAEIEAELDEEE